MNSVERRKIVFGSVLNGMCRPLNHKKLMTHAKEWTHRMRESTPPRQKVWAFWSVSRKSTHRQRESTPTVPTKQKLSQNLANESTHSLRELTPTKLKLKTTPMC